MFEELVCSDHTKTENQIIEDSLAKIRNPEVYLEVSLFARSTGRYPGLTIFLSYGQEWDMKMAPSQRSDVLLTLRQVALTFSSIPGRFGIEGETYYWTGGYHLNIRIYEKLLFGVFDILEESQIIEVWIFVVGTELVLSQNI